MKNKFVELPISTRDGKFIAHYSEKVWLELTGQRCVGERPREPRKRKLFPPKSKAGIAQLKRR